MIFRVRRERDLAVALLGAANEFIEAAALTIEQLHSQLAQERELTTSALRMARGLSDMLTSMDGISAEDEASFRQWREALADVVAMREEHEA